jgi:hypothetical protein
MGWTSGVFKPRAFIWYPRRCHHSDTNFSLGEQVNRSSVSRRLSLRWYCTELLYSSTACIKYPELPARSHHRHTCSQWRRRQAEPSLFCTSASTWSKETQCLCCKRSPCRHLQHSHWTPGLHRSNSRRSKSRRSPLLDGPPTRKRQEEAQQASSAKSETSRV